MANEDRWFIECHALSYVEQVFDVARKTEVARLVGEENGTVGRGGSDVIESDLPERTVEQRSYMFPDGLFRTQTVNEYDGLSRILAAGDRYVVSDKAVIWLECAHGSPRCMNCE